VRRSCSKISRRPFCNDFRPFGLHRGPSSGKSHPGFENEQTRRGIVKRMSSSSNTPPDGYFNDMSRPTGNSGRNKRNRSPSGDAADANGGDAASGGDNAVPKPKRIACIICRKRKLKCNGSKPSCSTCTRLGHSCAYDEVRRKSGPKRGYVKALEERLSKFET